MAGATHAPVIAFSPQPCWWEPIAQPLDPHRNPFVRATGNGKQRHLGVNRAQIALEPLEREVRMGDEVYFVQDYCVALTEQHWVLLRFVIALGGAEHGDFGRLPNVELARANQIADILDEKQVGLIQRETVECLKNQMGGNVATFAGVDLNDGDVQCLHALSIARCGAIGLDDGDAKVGPENWNRPLQKSRLARARRTNEIKRHNASRRESASNLVGQLLIGLQDILQNRNLGHRPSPPI